MQANFIVLGKSGAGKSSFINYLVGHSIAEVGIGEPVTKGGAGEKASLHQYPPVKIGRLDFNIFDSWGLEADKADEWIEILKREQEERDQSDDITQWIHAVVYCLSAERARIEDFEIESILKPLHKAGHKIIFAITKSDTNSNGRAFPEIEKILNKDLPGHAGAYKVCSVHVKKRTGESIPEGRKEVMRAIMNCVRDSLDSRYEHLLKNKFETALASWKETAIAYYEEKEDSFFFSRTEASNEISRHLSKSLEESLSSATIWASDSFSDIVRLYSLLGVIIRHDQTKERINTFQKHIDSTTPQTAAIAKLLFDTGIIPAFLREYLGGKPSTTEFNLYLSMISQHYKSQLDKLFETMKKAFDERVITLESSSLELMK